METDYIQKYKPVKLHFTSCSTVEAHDSGRPPIILVHGMFATNTTWNRVKSQIGNRTRRKVYCLDIRNHGKSEYTDEFTVRHLASDLLQFMEEQKIPTAVFVGHSAGGRAVMQLALTKPELVEKLVVEDISLTDADESKAIEFSTMLKTVHRAATQLPSSLTEADAYKIVQRVLARHINQLTMNGKTSDVMNTQFLYKDSKTGEFKFTFNVESLIKVSENLGLMLNDLSNDPVYTGKALFLKGEHSPIHSIMERDTDLILHHFPQAEFETVSKAQHAGHVECPEEFAGKVGDFILS